METHIYVVSRAGASNIKLGDSDLLRSCTGESIKSCERLLASYSVKEQEGTYPEAAAPAPAPRWVWEPRKEWVIVHGELQF